MVRALMGYPFTRKLTLLIMLMRPMWLRGMPLERYAWDR